jgi:WD40 repeat protein
MFGVMGEFGNMCMIYDTDSVILKHTVQAGQQLRAFEFSKDGQQLVCLLNDQKIRFYSLESFGGILVRELPNTHRTSINSADLSLNGGFMMTGGEDSLIKVWDSEAPKSVPYFYQAFIGHTYGV